MQVNRNCAVCPSGTRTDQSAGYRACRCLDGFARVDRFGSCTSCQGQTGVACSNDVRVLAAGYYWTFATPEAYCEYVAFVSNLALSYNYSRSLTQYNGSVPTAYVCPTQGNCLGGIGAACKNGTKGTLCAVCDDAFFLLNGNCFECPPPEASILVALFLTVISFVAAYYTLCNSFTLVSRNTLEVEQAVQTLSARTFANSVYDEHITGQPAKKHPAWHCSTVALTKILVGYAQILGAVSTVYIGVPWSAFLPILSVRRECSGCSSTFSLFLSPLSFSPSLPRRTILLLPPRCMCVRVCVCVYFVRTTVCHPQLHPRLLPRCLCRPTNYRGMTGSVGVLSANPLAIFLPSCIDPSLHMNGYTHFRCVVIAFIVGMVLLALYCVYTDVATDTETASMDGNTNAIDRKVKAIAAGVLLFSFMYPMITVSCVRIMAQCHSICSDASGLSCTSWMRSDYSLPCDTPEHDTYVAIATAIFVIIAVLFPAVIAAKLRSIDRPDAQDPSSTIVEVGVCNRGLRFLYMPYRTPVNYWEAVDLYRKLFITSVVVFITPGTPTFGPR